ncbi:unnamed protein product [Musa textilis]
MEVKTDSCLFACASLARLGTDRHERFDIQSIVYDEKKNTVTVSGPFDPECFIRKLLCLACKVIQDVQIKPPPPPPKPPQKPPSPPPPPPPPPQPPVCPFPPPWWPVCCKQPCPCFDPNKGCRRCCTCGWICFVPSPPVPKPPVLPKPPVCVFPPTGWPSCCNQPCPCFEPRNGCRRCCSCGWVCDGPPQSAACRPCKQVDGCKIVIGQEPGQSCSIM